MYIYILLLIKLLAMELRVSIMLEKKQSTLNVYPLYILFKGTVTIRAAAIYKGSTCARHCIKHLVSDHSILTAPSNTKVKL